MTEMSLISERKQTSRYRRFREYQIRWTARRSNQPTLKEISPGCSLEGLMLKLNSNTLATWCEELTYLKRPWCWERLRQEEKGMTEDEMVGWHHRHNGHGFEWTLGVGDGQGGLLCLGSWGYRVRHDWATELKLIETFTEIHNWNAKS